MLYPFNGIQYRSDVERQIAIGYTEMNVPFKYEPELWLEGMKRPVFRIFCCIFLSWKHVRSMNITA